MRPRTWGRSGRLVAAGALGTTLLVVSGLALMAGGTGCYGDQCVGDAVVFGDKEGEGKLISPDLWESQPQGAKKWLRYSHQRTYYVRLHGFEGRDIVQVFAYISPDEDPNTGGPGTQYTLAGGNLAEVRVTETNMPGHAPLVAIHNDTCADYYARFVVQAYPGGSMADGGAPDAEAGPDAGLDASRDTGAAE